MDCLVYYEDGYDLTENPYALPESFMRSAICAGLYVEFLKTTNPELPIHDKEKAANHAVFKIIFKDKHDGFLGMRLEMTPSYKYKSASDDIDGRAVRFKPGYLCIKPSHSTDPSSKTNWTCRLSIAQDCYVSHIIGLLLRYQASHFDFVSINDKYFGCRDFITQVICLWHSCGFIKSTEIDAVLHGPALPVTSIYDALGLRFSCTGRICVCPIEKGRFNVLPRYETSSMPYKGSERALQLASVDFSTD